jgi:hypothetical protein
MDRDGLNAIVLQKLSGNIQVTRLGIWVAHAGKKLLCWTLIFDFKK